VQEYTEQYYIPAASSYLRRAAADGALATQLAKRKQDLDGKWNSLRFGEVTIETKGDRHHFSASVRLGDIDPDAVRVELYANRNGDQAAVCQEMKRVGPVQGDHSSYIYLGSVSAQRPTSDYTPRITSSKCDMAVPLEESRILWQR
jgi:starch phosphorylase